MLVDWSAEIPFTRTAVRDQVPHQPGVYEFLQSREYPRYKAQTRIIKIGESSDLQNEVLNHFIRHTAANRISRINRQSGIIVTVIYAIIPAPETRRAQDELLRHFEDTHWEVPLLNSTRGYARDADKHYRVGSSIEPDEPAVPVNPPAS